MLEPALGERRTGVMIMGTSLRKPFSFALARFKCLRVPGLEDLDSCSPRETEGSTDHI